MSNRTDCVSTTASLATRSERKHFANHLHTHQLSIARLLWASAINVIFALVECIGGIFSNSLALISDAVHNLADALSIVVAYVAGRAALKPSTPKYTFGFRRFEILAALCNAVVLFVIYGVIFVKAFGRLHSHMHVDSRMLLIIATVGMVAKLVAMLILRRPSRGSLNVRAAYMHLLADLLSSITIILGGLAIQMWHLPWVDSLVSVCVGAYILFNTWPILRDCVRILMQAAPSGDDIDAISRSIENVAPVEAVSDAHLWQLTENDIYFSARVALRPPITFEKAHAMLAQAEDAVKRKFNVHHVLLALDTSANATPVLEKTNS